MLRLAEQRSVGGASLAALVFARHGYPVLVFAVLLMATGEMIYAPTVSAFVTIRAGRSRRASYQAALSSTEDIGIAIGPIGGLALAAATSAAAAARPAQRRQHQGRARCDRGDRRIDL